MRIVTFDEYAKLAHTCSDRLYTLLNKMQDAINSGVMHPSFPSGALDELLAWLEGAIALCPTVEAAN